MIRVVGRALLYFALVFGVGFLLGPVRVLWLASRVGERGAELIEAPLMLAAIALASHWIERRWCAGWSKGATLGVGACAAVGVLAADLGVGVGLRGMSVVQVFLGRDPVSGAVYYLLVAIMALAPFMWSRRSAVL